MNTDLTFFTNEPDATLLDRFRKTFAHVQYLDILVSYFRTSGFHLLYAVMESVDKIRILVGLSVDRQAFEIIDTFQSEMHQMELGLLSRSALAVAPWTVAPGAWAQDDLDRPSLSNAAHPFWGGGVFVSPRGGIFLKARGRLTQKFDFCQKSNFFPPIY